MMDGKAAMDDRRHAYCVMRPGYERRRRTERRRDHITADFAQLYVIYFDAFGKLPSGTFLQCWEIAALFDGRTARGDFRF